MSGRLSSTGDDFAEDTTSDDPYHDLSEHANARHKDNFGYTTMGAEINDHILAEQGKAPLSFDHRRRQSIGGRIQHFNKGVVGGIVG
jgi:hypothetical protein